MLIDWLQKPSTIACGLYLAAAELTSCLPSYSFSCILVSEENNPKNYSSNQTCAPVHEAVIRFLRFIWAYADRDNINAFAAVAVAVFTFTLWRSTLKLWEAGEKQIAVAKQSADAAKVSADALKATERGVLIEKVAALGLVEAFSAAENFPNSPTMGASEINLKAQIALKNYGKTPVTIFNVHGDISISEKPPEGYSAAWLIDRVLSEYTIAPQAQTDVIEIANKQEISWAMSNQLVRRTAHIWLIGTVRFVDIFDETCLREFIWKYDRQTNGFKLHRSDEKRSRQ